jgi:hypothetical protein
MSPRAGVPPVPPAFTVAEVLRVGLRDYTREHRLPPQHWRVLRAIMACRTPELGGHLYQCSNCGTEQFVPHSCRNRHCPTCQGANGYAWMQQQADSLLPIPYFHVVFTLPHVLNPLMQQNQQACYDLLFASASATLLEFGRHELQAQLGITMVLHTWSQSLGAHFHVHAIVTGGGLRDDGTWAGTPPHWLFPVLALSPMFRGKFRAGLKQLYQDGKLEFHGQQAAIAAPVAFAAFLQDAANKKFVVYAKRPFAGPETVLAYLARYTHRIGITNRRILALDASTHTVTFDYKDYADGAKHKSMIVSCGEFVRRLLLHILPERFVKLRHYGLLANRNRRTRIEEARAALPPPPPAPSPPPAGAADATPAPDLPPGLPARCPHCHQPTEWILLRRVARPHARPVCTVPVLDSS